MPPITRLTPVETFGDWAAKRDDYACRGNPETDPSGSKVRQFAAMIAAAPGAPLVVGCSADSAMQIYVAAAARACGVSGYVFVAARKVPTAATVYARRAGATVETVRPGHLSVIRARARAFGKTLPACVRWDVQGAVRDAAAQTANLPDAGRVVIPCGSGLTAAGVAAGVARQAKAWTPQLLLVAVSPLADLDGIRRLAAGLTVNPLPEMVLARAPGGYGDPVAARLPDGTPLDPFYGAKALAYVRPGDCLWVPGLRPYAAFPAAIRAALGV